MQIKHDYSAADWLKMSKAKMVGMSVFHWMNELQLQWKSAGSLWTILLTSCRQKLLLKGNRCELNGLFHSHVLGSSTALWVRNTQDLWDFREKWTHNGVDGCESKQTTGRFSLQVLTDRYVRIQPGFHAVSSVLFWHFSDAFCKRCFFRRRRIFSVLAKTLLTALP